MTPTALLRAVLADRLGLQAADWRVLAATHGEALAPYAGMAPVDEPGIARWRQQILVEALGHLGTLQELATWELPHLVVKGLPWAAAFWGDALVRPAHDVDIVIEAGHTRIWQARLQATGFQPGQSPLVWRRGRQIVQIHDPASRTHWLHHVQPDWADFDRRAVTTDIAGVQVRQPDPADTLLYLAHHQVFQHGFHHDLGWVDLAGWIRAHAEAWSDLACQRAAGTHLQASLQVLNWIWQENWQLPPFLDLPIPPAFMRLWALQALRHGTPLVQTALSLVLATPAERFALLKAAPAAGQRFWFGRQPGRQWRQKG